MSFFFPNLWSKVDLITIFSGILPEDTTFEFAKTIWRIYRHLPMDVTSADPREERGIRFKKSAARMFFFGYNFISFSSSYLIYYSRWVKSCILWTGQEKLYLCSSYPRIQFSVGRHKIYSSISPHRGFLPTNGFSLYISLGWEFRDKIFKSRR